MDAAKGRRGERKEASLLLTTHLLLFYRVPSFSRLFFLFVDIRAARVRDFRLMSLLQTKLLSQRLALGACLILLLMMAGCGGSLYKVRPAINGPMTGAFREARGGGILLRAAPLLTDEESQELFEANLPLVGLLPVRIEMTNESSAAIPLKRLKFRLTDDSHTEWKTRAVKDVVSRILKSDEVTLYNPNSKKSFADALSVHAFKADAPLGAAERRQGLIFFQSPKKEPVASPHGLTLILEGLPQPVEIRLN